MSNINVAKFGAVVAVLAASLLAFGGSALAATFDLGPTTLRVGSSGMYVKNLQMNLSACGQAASADGSFGPMTRAAVVAFQTGKTTADGIVGPATKALLVSCGGSSTGGSSTVSGCLPGYVFSPTTGQSCSTGTSGGTNTGGLSGGAGDLNDVDFISSLNNEDVGEGEDDVEFLGLELEADEGSDLSLTATRIEFEEQGGGGSDDLDDYASEVTVWFEGEQVGSADVDDFSESGGVWSKSINLSGAVIDSGESADLTFAITANNSIDSTDLAGNDWVATVANVRFVDAQGAVITEDDLGDIGAGRAFEFVSFATSADTELQFSTDSDSPEAGIVLADDSDSTDEVVLLKGEIDLEGDSDVVIDEFPVTLTTSGATDVDEVTSSITLVINGEEYTESVSTATVTTATVTFDDLDFTLEAGEKISFEILADINDIEVGSFEEGDMLKASVTSTNVSHMDAENEEGDQLSDSEKTGTSTGEYQEFRTQGISLELVSTDGESSNDTGALNDTGTFTIKFKVTAVGDDVYLATTVAAGFTYVVDVGSTTTTQGVSAAIVNNTDSDRTAGENWLIEEGESETLTLTVSKVNSITAANAALTRVRLTGVLWDDDDTGASAPDSTYSSNMEDFMTEYISMN